MTISIAQSEFVSSFEQPLFSDRHDNCHNIVAVNLDSGEAHMFHVWEAA